MTRVMYLVTTLYFILCLSVIYVAMIHMDSGLISISCHKVYFVLLI